MAHLGVRLSPELGRRLGEVASARGLTSRSEAVRLLIREAGMSPVERETVPDRAELLVLLADSARGGSVTAMKALLEEHRRDGASDDAKPKVSAIDELAARRAAGAG